MLNNLWSFIKKNYIASSGVALVFLILMIVVPTVSSYSEANHKKQEIITQAQMLEVTQISPLQLSNFIEYLKYQQNMFDSRAEIISKAIIDASDTKGSAQASYEPIKLNEAVQQHKKEIENTIVNISNVYNSVNKKQNVDSYELSNFLTLYSKYNSRLLLVSDIEAILNKYAYTTEVNVAFNKEHKVFEAIEAEKQKKISEFNDKFSKE